ncbi:protoporphyrinogen/coproporphyrinogen oxidase [Microbacterium ulmi]|uniref:NAD(P)-binding protein n=1 Tax=Microbacterium ulmi TaxID=179095 RepID=A0A7Y2LZE5_9MICO|nr:FAD-dependent oxidoreductase [Microbacterium ulmi]NII69150.1 oxygen-dependent protoporphyrinogen oxidase [Microbacterium ulmi]NNH03691.1 NAD(P)-binding protein [Microbacterium ulmi]
MTDAATADLAEAARSHHVIVVGGGVAGLVAALECAKVGLRVTLVEEAAALGGAVRSAEVGGVVLDAAVEGFWTHEGTVRAFVEELGLDVVPAAPSRPWVVGGPRSAAPLPRQSVLGVPENAWDESVRRVIGWSGTWRAYLDRLRPPLTIGTERSLGRLVRTRMGDKVLDRLVAPGIVATHGVHPDDIDVDLAAPGLSTALTRTGSLGGAVAQLRGDEPSSPEAETIGGGMTRLVDALRDRLVELDAQLHMHTRVAALVRRDDGRWDAETEPARLAPADAVVVATPEREARRLLAPHVPALGARDAASWPVEVVTLVVDAPALDGHPRGDAVYTVPGSHRAVSVVQSTARWPALAARFPDGTHVLRVAFGSRMQPPATAGLDDADAVRLARSEAEALLGLQLTVTAAAREAFETSPPASALGRADMTLGVRGALRAVGGLAATGAWLAGSGLARVVQDAFVEADEVRRTLLWEGRGPRG